MATYTIDWNNNWLLASVAYGASATLIGAFSASFSPASALSGISIGGINLGSNYPTRFSSVSTNLGDFPILVANNDIGESDVYYYSTVFNNNVLRADTQLVSATTQMYSVTALLSAGADDSVPDVYTASDISVRLLTAEGPVLATYTIDWNNNWLATSVAYGASATLIGTVSASFSPASAISAINIGGINLLGSNYSTRFATITTNIGEFPNLITNKGDGTSDVYYYSTIFNNNVLHTSTQLVSGTTQMAGVTALLSAGTLAWPPDVYTASDISVRLLTALGDAGAPSGVSGFTATAGTNEIVLTWNNSVEADVSGTQVQYSTTSVPSAYTEGTTVYNGTAETYTHTGLDDQTTYYYSAFAYDNVGNYDTLGDGATGSANPNWNLWPSQAEHTRLYEVGLI